MYMVVNKSGRNIPVFWDTGKTQQIGTIFPNEYYVIDQATPWYTTSTAIRFRNSSGNFVAGLIVHWGFGDDPPTNQDPINLRPVEYATINGVTHSVLHVRRNVRWINPDGTVSATVITPQMKVAIRNNTTGSQNKAHLLFYWVWHNELGRWVTPNGQGYAFVETGLASNPGGSTVSTASVYGV